MRVTKLSLAVISVLVIAGTATPWLIRRQSEIKLSEEIHSLQAQVDQLDRQRIEDERVSNLIAQAGSPLPDDQLRELLKLRSEVGLLRKQTNELLKLQTENRQLRSDQASGKAQREPKLAAGELVPIESLAFAGYATPEATLQSTLSADFKGNLKTFLDGFTPERRPQEERGFTEKSESELAALAAERAAYFAASSVRILDSRLVSDDEAELIVFVTAEDRSTALTMKRIAGEWKISADKH
jgi:outer membrane murein-binding lipoprotein Lpp